MEFKSLINLVQNGIINSVLFPYKTGQLKNNFIDKGSEIISDKVAEFSVLSNPLINYGIILENANTIRYGLKKVGYKYKYIEKSNRHWHYQERINEHDIIPLIEDTLGVKRI